MKACPLIFGILLFLVGIVLVGFTFRLRKKIEEHPKILGAKHFKTILKKAETECPDANHMDLTGAPYTSTPAAINTVLHPTTPTPTAFKCRSINSNYVITHEHCHASVFTPGYCGKCTAIGVHYEKFVKKQGWELQKVSSLGVGHAAANSNEEWNGVSYVNQTLPKILFKVASHTGTQVNTLVPLMAPPANGNKLYKSMTKTVFFDTQIIQRGGLDHTCYGSADVAALDAKIGASGAADADLAGINTKSCEKPADGDVRFTGYCLGKPDAELRRIMGMWFHNTTTTYTTYTPHKIPTMNKYGCDEKNTDGTYSDDCMAKFIWFDKDTTSTNAVVLQNASKAIDKKITDAFGIVKKIRLGGAVVAVLGLILSILGCAL